MKKFDYVIADPLGIYVSPASMLARIAKSYGDTMITVAQDGNIVKDSQLIKLMELGIKHGSIITVTAEGPAEEEAITAIKKFFEENP